MKRLLAVTVAASLASGAMASVGFEFGAQFFYPRLDSQGFGELWTGQGQTFGVNWGIGNDLSLGVHAESLAMTRPDGNNSGSFSAQAVSVSRSVVRNATVGLRIGSFTEDISSNGGSGLLADLVGKVTLIRGTGEKVNGELNASVGGRLADATASSNNGNNWGGWFLNFGVAIGI